MRAFVVSASLVASLVCIHGAPASLNLHTDTLSVSLDAKSAWTIRSVEFAGTPLIIPAGGQGAVLMPQNGNWIGSTMGSDEAAAVSAFNVSADGNAVAIDGFAKLKGKIFSLRKESMLGQFRHTAETIIEGDTIHQTHSFKATAGMDLKTFHGFLYSFTPNADTWMAGTSGGDLLSGRLTSRNGHVPTASVRWLAVYDTDANKGVVIHFQTPFSSQEGIARIWDAKSYRKLLFQPRLRTVKAGTELEYKLAMRFVEAKPDDWEQRAQATAVALQKQFPAPQPPPTTDDNGLPLSGTLTLRTANYTVPFSADRAWTIERMIHRGEEFSGGNGFHGTVLAPESGKWWGTGHGEGGREVVHSLSLRVDGEDQPIRANGEVSGNRVLLSKNSTIWKFDATVAVELTDDYVLEQTRLEALEDCETSILYFFMHCFPPTTKAWLAELPDGSLEEGKLTDSKTMAVNKDTRWVAQYDPETKRSTLCYTPQVITGTRSASMIWDLDRYHKYYLCQNRGQKFRKGDRLVYTVLVKVIEGETSNWTKTKQAVADLKRRFEQDLNVPLRSQ